MQLDKNKKLSLNIMKTPIWKLNSKLLSFMLCLGSEVCNEDERAAAVDLKELIWIFIWKKYKNN